MNIIGNIEVHEHLPRLQILKMILTSQYWLIVALCGAFFTFFALNRGGIVVFVHACFIMLIINIVFGEYKLWQIPKSYWITAGVFFYLLLSSAVFYPKISHYRWMSNSIRMLCLVFAIHCMSLKKMKDWVPFLFCAVVSAAVCWQVVAYHIFKMPYGTFSNPHYIGSFSMLTLPLIFYSLLTIDKWYKIIFLVVMLLDIDLLIRTGSRPAIVGITLGVLFVFFLMNKGRWRWVGIILLCGFAMLLHITHYAGIAGKIEQLMLNFSKETRPLIWYASWNMLKQNSLMAWFLGNGIGSFRISYPQFAAPVEIDAIFPHLHFIEVLYQNGLVGAGLVFGGVGFLLKSAIRSVKTTSSIKKRILTKCIIVVFIGWMVHSGLSFPFHSKYSQYSLAFILGTLLVLVYSENN